jgi:hypothetical protein
MWTAGIVVLLPYAGYLLTEKATNPLADNRNYVDIESLDEEKRSESYQSVNEMVSTHAGRLIGTSVRIS